MSESDSSAVKIMKEALRGVVCAKRIYNSALLKGHSCGGREA